MQDQSAIERRALRAVAVQFLINGAVAASYIPRLPEIRDALQVDVSVIGQILTWASVGGLLGSWLAGRIVPLLGTRKTMIGGTLLLVLLLPLIAQASSVWLLLWVMAAIMLVDVVVDVSMNIQGSNLSARRDVPVMNRLHGLWSVGAVLGGLLATGMASMSVPLHWHLLGAAVLMALALCYIGGGLLTSDESVSAAQGQQARRRSGQMSVPLWVFAALGAASYIPEMVGSDWAPFRLADDLSASGGVAGLGYVAFTCGMVIGRLAGDWAVSLLGKARLQHYALALALAGLMLACLVDVYFFVFSGLLLAGLGVSTLFPALYDCAAQDPHRPAAALGAMTAGGRGIMLLAPWAMGHLANTSSFSVGMAMALFALPCLVVVGVLTIKYFSEQTQ